jgi:biotin transport system substrate-specific component
MNEELFVPLPSAKITNAPSHTLNWLRASGIVLAGSVLAAICAHVSIPLFFTPVPLSLQPFAVLLLGLLLTPGMAATTFAVYLLEGAAGLPVFAPSLAMPGLAHLSGPTGGYLLAYPVASALISFLWRRSGRGFSAALASAAAGDVFILFCGGLWMTVLTHGALLHASVLAVAPFLPGDALKIAAAAGMGFGLIRYRRSRETRHKGEK